MFEPLWKVFYENSKEHKLAYAERFNCSKQLEINIRHENAYPAFYYYPEELVLIIQDIFVKHHNLMEIIKGVPALMLHQFELACIIEEVSSTSAIEGVHSTHRELKEVLEGTSGSQQFSSIIKKYALLISGESINFNTCKNIRVFYDEFAHTEVIRDNPADKLDGELFRADAVDVLSSSGKIIHRGIYPESEIIRTMDYALSLLHDISIPVLIRIAVFHYLFVYIHPFYNGNGRTARFISSYLLARHFHYLPALRLSMIIKHQRTQYYKLIKDTDSEINCGDLTTFIFGFMSMISETFTDIENTLLRKLNQLENYRKMIASLGLKDSFTEELYYLLLQSSMFFGQGASMEDLMRLTGKTRNTIKSRLETLPKEHLIIRKNKKFFYKLNMMLFR